MFAVAQHAVGHLCRALFAELEAPIDHVEAGVFERRDVRNTSRR